MLSDNVIYNFYYAWWKKIDKTIFLLIIFLFGLGLFFSLVSTSLIASDKLNTNNYFFFFKHLIYICLGILILIFFSSLNKKPLFTLSILLFFISLFFLPRFQPIELVKPFTIIFIATILSSEKNYNIYYKYFISFIVIVPISFLLMMQPDIG